MQKVKDLTIDEFRAAVGEVIEEKLRELLMHPDTRSALRPEVLGLLDKDLRGPQSENEDIPAAEVTRRQGMEL